MEAPQPVRIKQEPVFEEISIKEENEQFEEDAGGQVAKPEMKEEPEFVPMNVKLEPDLHEEIDVSPDENYHNQSSVTSVTGPYHHDPTHNFNHSIFTTENGPDEAGQQSADSTTQVATYPMPEFKYVPDHSLTPYVPEGQSMKTTEVAGSAEVDPNYSCSYCPASFGCESLLSKHLRQPYENLAKATGNAVENFTVGDESVDPLMHFRSQLRKNLLARSPAKPSEVPAQKPRLVACKIHACEECGATFPHDSNLRRHRLTHTGEKPWACDKCPARFNQKGNLQTHQRTRHSYDRPFVCLICNATFNCKATLKGHLISHSGQRMFECTQCSMKFMRKRSLEEHMRGHSGERPYVCEVCNADFNHRGSYTLHMRMHTNDKRYACAHCPARFIQRVSLQLHMQKHTGEKPHKCTICGARFGLKSHLQAHHLTHTGEKPWKCDICDVKFARKAYVQYHRRTHTGEKPFACTICDAKFSSKKGWKNHMQAHAEEDEEGKEVENGNDLEDGNEVENENELENGIEVENETELEVSAGSGVHFLQPLEESQKGSRN